MNGLAESVSPEYKEIVLNNQYFQPQVDFNKYLASPAEITARTREAQRYLADVLLNNPTRNAEVANLSTRERVAFLLGDFSVLSDSAFDDVFSYSFLSMQKNQGRGVINMFNNVLDGGEAVMLPTLEPHRIQTNISDKKKEAISNLFKFSLVTLGAAGSYGAMDNQGGQPSNSMYAGGVITMRKKKKGNVDYPKITIFTDMYKKQYQDGGEMRGPQGVDKGVAQLQAMKQAYDRAVKQKDMETIGKIESLVMDMFQSTDDPRVKEALSMMFPTMDAMMERPEGEPPAMSQGGPMKKRGVPTNDTSKLELEKQRASSLPFVKDDSYLSIPDEDEAKKLLVNMGYKECLKWPQRR